MDGVGGSVGAAVGAGDCVGFGVEVAVGRRVTVGSRTTVGVGAVGSGVEQALTTNTHNRNSRKALLSMAYDCAALYSIRNNRCEVLPVFGCHFV